MLGVSHLSYVREDTVVEVEQPGLGKAPSQDISLPPGASSAPPQDASPQGRVHQRRVVVVPRLTFLYKLVVGAADQSFGLNVAAMAGLPETVVRRAAEKAQVCVGVGVLISLNPLGDTHVLIFVEGDPQFLMASPENKTCC